MAKVLITGGHGFIGSHLVRRLLQEGYEVAILKRETSNTSRIADLLDKIKVYNADICNTQEVSEAISSFNPDIIYHLATYYAVEHNSKELPVMIDTNILGTINLLEASKAAKVNLFINISSCFVYDRTEKKLAEDSVVKPFNLYAATKLMAEQACSYYADKEDFKIVTLRLFPPYGPADNNRRLIPSLIKDFTDKKSPKMTKGEQKWSFTYVEDIIDAFIKVIDNQNIKKNYEVFNIGIENATSIKAMALKIKSILNAEVNPSFGELPYRKDEFWFLCSDSSKAKKLLNWKPKTQIDEGLKLTIDWYKEHEKNKRNN